MNDNKDEVPFSYESKLVEGDKLFNVEVKERRDQGIYSDIDWFVSVYKDRKNPLFQRVFVFPDDFFACRGVPSKNEVAARLIQFRHDAPVKGNMSGIDASFVSQWEPDYFAYPDTSAARKMMTIGGILRIYFQDCKDPIKPEHIVHSTKIDIENVERILRQFTGYGVIDENGWPYPVWLDKMADAMKKEGIIGTASPTVAEADGNQGKRVFIVHGRDIGTLKLVSSFIRELGLETIILHEMAGKGMTLPEKLEAYKDVQYAIIIMTGDDEGRPAGEKEFMRRARQNVILELGYFWGHLGRARFHALYGPGVEMPSDYLNVEYTGLDEEGKWKKDIFGELLQVWPDLKFPD